MSFMKESDNGKVFVEIKNVEDCKLSFEEKQGYKSWGYTHIVFFSIPERLYDKLPDKLMVDSECFDKTSEGFIMPYIDKDDGIEDDWDHVAEVYMDFFREAVELELGYELLEVMYPHLLSSFLNNVDDEISFINCLKDYVELYVSADDLLYNYDRQEVIDLLSEIYYKKEVSFTVTSTLNSSIIEGVCNCFNNYFLELNFYGKGYTRSGFDGNLIDNFLEVWNEILREINSKEPVSDDEYKLCYNGFNVTFRYCNL